MSNIHGRFLCSVVSEKYIQMIAQYLSLWLVEEANLIHGTPIIYICITVFKNCNLSVFSKHSYTYQSMFKSLKNLYFYFQVYCITK